MAIYEVQLIHNPLKEPEWSAVAYPAPVDHSAQFLPGADFSGQGETEEAAIANLKQRMRAWQDRKESYWLPLTIDETGEPKGVA